MRTKNQKKYKARTLRAHRYAETFRKFMSISTEYSAMVEQLMSCGRQIASNESAGGGFSCLDVGAGTGELIRDWVAAADDDRKQGGETWTAPSRYVGIEPNQDLSKSLEESLKELSLKGTVLRLPFSPDVSLEKELGDEEEKCLFDMVLFSHSLYFMPDAEPCVRHAMEYLKPNGLALIFIQGPFGFYLMHHLFEPLLDRGVETSVFAYHGISSHEIVQDLRFAGYNPVVRADKTFLDLTNLGDSTKTHERDEVISFILQAEFSEISEPLKTDILQTLEDACTLDADGNLRLHHPNMAIKVLRQRS